MNDVSLSSKQSDVTLATGLLTGYTYMTSGRPGGCPGTSWVAFRIPGVIHGGRW